VLPYSLPVTCKFLSKCIPVFIGLWWLVLGGVSCIHGDNCLGLLHAPFSFIYNLFVAHIIINLLLLLLSF
jgi:hypothetical protein